MPSAFKKLLVIALLICPLAAVTSAADGLSSDQADQILSELREIKALLEAKPVARTTPQRARLEVNEIPFVGDKNAPITVVEFTDYECPFCRRFQAETFQNMKAKYIDSGKVRFYVSDFPLNIHKDALLAAQAARCSLEQGQFWPMHNKMQADGTNLDLNSLVDLARGFQMDADAFRHCVESGRFTEAILESQSSASAMGIRATPNFR